MSMTQESSTPEKVSGGTLGGRTVAALLLDQAEAGVTGSLVLTRGQMRKEIFLRDGTIVGAESNLRQEALGSLLLERGVIDERQLALVLSELKQRGQKMGSVLVELGWFSPEVVLDFLAAQVRKRVVDSLRWSDGVWSFVPGEEFARRIMEHPTDTEWVVFAGLAKTTSAEGLMARLEQDGPRPIRLGTRFPRFRKAFERALGNELLPLLDDEPLLASMVLRPSADTLFTAIEALILTELATLGPPVETADDGFRADPIDVYALERLGADAASGGPPPEVTPPPSVNPTAIGTGRAAPTLPPAVGPAAARRELLRAYLDVHGKPPHQILGVATSATREEVTQAFAEKMQQFADEAYSSADLGEDRPKLDVVRAAFERAFDALAEPVRDDDADRTARSHAIDPLGAELSFQDGLGALAAGDAGQAAIRFQEAVDARPDQAAYHAYLGWALFQATGEAAAEPAGKHLKHALALDPDLPDAHLFLGRVADSAGDAEGARRHLERTLAIDPSRIEAVDLLVRVHTRAGDVVATERLYRRVIAGLGERSLTLRRRLWKELGDLYEGELGDRGRARLAYEMAAKLAPRDTALARKVIELAASDPVRWRETARALAAEWRARPDQAERGKALYNCYVSVGQNDAAVLVATAQVLRRVADDETRRIAERHRPRFLPRIGQPLSADARKKIAHPGEDPDLEALFALLASAGVMIPFSLLALGVSEDAPLTADALPPQFRRVFDYVARTLGATLPLAFYRHASLGGDARLADVRPHALLLGPALLDTGNTLDIGFRIGRALALASPGRIAGSARSGVELRPYLEASLAFGRAGTGSGGGPADAIRKAISAAGPDLVTRVAEVAERLAGRGDAVDLNDWARALNRAATRLGLVVAGDLLRIGQFVAEEDGPAALEDLIDFAIGPEHVEIRMDLGTSAVV